MIVSKLMGGNSNQLFQWAIARSLELDGYGQSYLDISFYNNQQGSTVREFELGKYPFINYKLINEYRPNGSGDMRINQFNDNFIYQNILPIENDVTLLNGYWQSEKYFKHNEDVIRKELSPSSDIQQKLVSKYPDLLKSSVSIHIRRTDYIRQQQNHPLQPIEYYEDGLKLIPNFDVIYVFSDDIEWCKENLKFDKMIFVQNDSDQEDLWHMAMCSYNIISNSSFSWWGAWLNSNPNKVVIAPNLWFGDSLNLPTNDLIPSDWIKI